MIKRNLYDYNFNSPIESFCDCRNCQYNYKCIISTEDLNNGNSMIKNCSNFHDKNSYSVDRIIKGKLIENQYGSIQFCNPFQIDLLDIKRFYVITLEQERMFREWHGHQFEKKWCFVLTGTVKIGIVKIDDFANPSDKLIPEWYILKEGDCEILSIPGGYANNMIKISGNDQPAKVIFFSDFSAMDSSLDDYRYPNTYWR